MESASLQKLTDPKILGIFISSLKSAYKQQENKKKNYKKLINSFSIRVQKYEDSSSHNKTDDGCALKVKKGDISNKLHKKRRFCKNQNENNNDSNIQEMMKSIKGNNNKSKKIFIYSGYEGAQDDFKYPFRAKPEEYLDKENKPYEYECEYNSDSSIYTKENFMHNNPDTFDDEEEFYFKSKNRNHFSLTKSIQHERSKFLKHKFSKQMDQANSKKFSQEKDAQAPKYVNNGNIDNTIYNSYKSNNSNEKKNLIESRKLFDYYLIKSLEKNKDLIFYDEENYNNLKYDENSKCYYSLDHKSKIIYIKPSPKLMSSINSIFNSKIYSKKATKNISNELSGNVNDTPKMIDNGQSKVSKILSLDHEVILEKLKDLELMRNDKDGEHPLENSGDISSDYESKT